MYNQEISSLWKQREKQRKEIKFKYEYRIINKEKFEKEGQARLSSVSKAINELEAEIKEISYHYDPETGRMEALWPPKPR